MTNKEAIRWLHTAEILDLCNGNSKDRQAVNLAIDALRKTIPEPPYENDTMYQCPYCRRSLTYKTCVKKTYEYCPKCGQRILWWNIATGNK